MKGITTLVLPSAKQDRVHKTKREANSWTPGNTLILAGEQQTAVTRVTTRVQQLLLTTLRKRFLRFHYKGAIPH